MRNSGTLKKRTSYKSMSGPKSKSSSSSGTRFRSKSRSRSKSKSKSSSSSSIGGPPVLRREYQEIKVTKKQAGEIIKHRVEKTRNNPPSSWEKWNKDNARLFLKNASIPYPEYNEIFDKKNGFPF